MKPIKDMPTDFIIIQEVSMDGRARLLRDASLALLDQLGGSDFLEGLVGELEILLDVDVVLDLQEDDWRCDDEATAQEGPVGCEEGHILDLVEVEAT